MSYVRNRLPFGAERIYCRPRASCEIEAQTFNFLAAMYQNDDYYGHFTGYEELQGCIFGTIELGKEDDTDHIPHLLELDEIYKENPAILIFLGE